MGENLFPKYNILYLILVPYKITLRISILYSMLRYYLFPLGPEYVYKLNFKLLNLNVDIY